MRMQVDTHRAQGSAPQSCWEEAPPTSEALPAPSLLSGDGTVWLSSRARTSTAHAPCSCLITSNFKKRKKKNYVFALTKHWQGLKGRPTSNDLSMQNL